MIRQLKKPQLKTIYSEKEVYGRFVKFTRSGRLVNLGLESKRIEKCIDNGPMEDFWGILKRERDYGKRFTSREEFVQMIENYITYYNSCRVQRNQGVLTPMEKHDRYLLVA